LKAYQSEFIFKLAMTAASCSRDFGHDRNSTKAACGSFMTEQRSEIAKRAAGSHRRNQMVLNCQGTAVSMVAFVPLTLG
jgi:hypothetical protein